MAFDPSVISSIADNQVDPVTSATKAVTLRDAMDNAQLNKLQMGAKKAQIDEDQKVQAYLKTQDYSTPQGADAAAAGLNRISPRAAMDFRKTTQAFQSGQVQQRLDQLTLADQRMGHLVSTLDPIIVEARAMKSKGASDLEVNAFVANRVTAAANQLRGQKLDDGQPIMPDETLKAVTEAPKTLATLEAWENGTKQGQALIKQHIEQHKLENADRKQDETERHNRALEDNASQRTDLARDKIQRDASGGLTSDTVDFVAQRYLAGDTSVMQGLSKSDRAAIQNRTKDIAQIAGLTGKDAAANRAEFSGLMAGERTLAQRQANIDTASQEFQNVVPSVLEAARDLPRGAFVPWNKLQQIWERGTSDPQLAKFAQGARTLANLYTRATVPGASSVSDREQALHDLPTYTDEKSFEATVDFMQKEIAAAKQSPRDVRADLRENVTGKKGPPGAAETRAGASPPAGPPAASGGPAAGGKLAPGSTYRHASGATVEILPDEPASAGAPAAGTGAPDSSTSPAAASGLDLKRYEVPADDPSRNRANWARRPDGTQKGEGFLGLLKRPDGKISSEISVGVEIGGREVEIPTLVPTLSRKEVEYLLNNPVEEGARIPPTILKKAIEHARARIEAGKSPFAGPGEGEH